MRAIKRPKLSLSCVYKECTSSKIKEAKDKVELEKYLCCLDDIEREYLEVAQSGFTSDLRCHAKSVINLDQEGRRLLVNVYTQRFSKQASLGREYYDEIMNSAQMGICPTCGARSVRTLDHYLPKEKYPLLSVLPINLTPMCSDCNRDKGAFAATPNDPRFLHPYFDSDESIFDCLTAELQETLSPLAVKYTFTDSGAYTNSRHAVFMAAKLKLNPLYSNSAAAQLGDISSTLRRFLPEASSEKIKEYLLSEAKRHEDLPFVWKTPLYLALAKNDWYCAGGYNK
jgi:hypothetical protein